MGALKKEKGIRNIKKPDLKGKTSSLVFALLALVLTILVFGILLFLQNIFKEDVTYKQVVIAKTDIPEGEIITMGNAQLYFDVKSMNILDTMEGSLTNIDNIIDSQAKVMIYAGEIVTEKDFRKTVLETSQFENPVEISVDVGAVANADGGKIRAGDTINLAMMFTRDQLGITGSLQTISNEASTPSLFDIASMVDDEDDLFANEDEEDAMLEEEADEEEIVELTSDDLLGGSTSKKGEVTKSNYVFDYYAEYVLQDLYVVKALDGAGVEIAPTNTESTASILVFVIDKSDELALNNALANCANIRVSKVVEKVATPVKAKTEATATEGEAEATPVEETTEATER